MRARYLAALGLCLCLCLGLPFAPVRTQSLLPVQTLQICRRDGQILVITEAGRARGPDLAAALEALRAGSPGQVYFDTAAHVLLSEAELIGPVLELGLLRPAARVYRLDRPRDPQGLARLLGAHPSPLRLSRLQRAREEKEDLHGYFQSAPGCPGA